MENKNNFNFMRLIFSIMVVYSHSFGLLSLTEPTILGRSFGNFAVHCFFALSGYLITISFVNSKGVTEFTYKRILRIVPAYIVAYFLGKILVSFCNRYIDNPVPYIINGTVWTLSYEILAYAIIALIGFLGLLKANSIGSFWLAGWIAIIINYNNQSPTYQVIVPMLFLFLSGAFIAVNEKHIKIKIIGGISIILLTLIAVKPLALVGLFTKIPWLYGASFSPSTINYFIYLFLLPIAIVYIGKYIFIKVNIKNDISYGIYIYTWPIQQTIIYYFVKSHITLSPYLLFIFSILMSGVFSFLSWKIVEKPSLTLKKYDVYDLINRIVGKITNKINSQSSI